MSTYSLTLRNSLNRRLTPVELDDNFLYLQNLANGGGTGSVGPQGPQGVQGIQGATGPAGSGSGGSASFTLIKEFVTSPIETGLLFLGTPSIGTQVTLMIL